MKMVILLDSSGNNRIVALREKERNTTRSKRKNDQE